MLLMMVLKLGLKKSLDRYWVMEIYLLLIVGLCLIGIGLGFTLKFYRIILYGVEEKGVVLEILYRIDDGTKLYYPVVMSEHGERIKMDMVGESGHL